MNSLVMPPEHMATYDASHEKWVVVFGLHTFELPNPRSRTAVQPGQGGYGYASVLMLNPCQPGGRFAHHRVM